MVIRRAPGNTFFLMQNVLQQRLSQLCGTVKGRNDSEQKLLSLYASCLLMVPLDCRRIQKQDTGCAKNEQYCPTEHGTPFQSAHKISNKLLFCYLKYDVTSSLMEWICFKATAISFYPKTLYYRPNRS